MVAVRRANFQWDSDAMRWAAGRRGEAAQREQPPVADERCVSWRDEHRWSRIMSIHSLPHACTRLVYALVCVRLLASASRAPTGECGQPTSRHLRATQALSTRTTIPKGLGMQPCVTDPSGCVRGATAATAIALRCSRSEREVATAVAACWACICNISINNTHPSI